MNKIKTSNIIICLILTLITFIIFNSKTIIESVNISVSLWKDNIFPSLFPFLILNNLLLEYNFLNKISFLFKNIMTKIYHLKEETAFVLLASLFSGFPSGAKYTTKLLEKKIINLEEAETLITFTHYSNPIFIIGIIGNSILLNRKIAILILIAHIITNLIIGYLFRPQKININNTYKVNIKETKSLGESLKTSIQDALNTLFLLLGTITIFSCVITMLTNIIDCNNYLKVIISGLLEMTQGIKQVSLLNISLYSKTILITLFISFSGLSVHLQVISIISEYKIKYKYFLESRILHSILSIILVSILYFIFN